MSNTDQINISQDKELDSSEELVMDYYDYKAISSLIELLCTNLSDLLKTMQIKSSTIAIKYIMLHAENIFNVYNMLFMEFTDQIIGVIGLNELHVKIINQINIFDIKFIDIKIPLVLKTQLKNQLKLKKTFY